MSGHTHGPWAPEFAEAYNVRAPHGGIVAQIHNLKGRSGLAGRISGDEAAANARLVAASPELLDALIECERALNQIRCCCQHTAWDSTGPAVIAARAAIAKATGEQS